MKHIETKEHFGTDEIKINCGCGNPKCAIVLSHGYWKKKKEKVMEYESEIEFTVQEHNILGWKPFYVRIWYAVKLIFGRLTANTGSRIPDNIPPKLIPDCLIPIAVALPFTVNQYMIDLVAEGIVNPPANPSNVKRMNSEVNDVNLVTT